MKLLELESALSHMLLTARPTAASSATPSRTYAGRLPRPSIYSRRVFTRDGESAVSGKLGVVNWKDIRAEERWENVCCEQYVICMCMCACACACVHVHVFILGSAN